MKPINLQIENLSENTVGLLLGLAPWLTPLSAMQITITNMYNRLDYWLPVAIATGLSIEILGMATLSTALTFYQHNRRYSDEKNKMPMAVPAFAFGFYLVLVMAIVILLEIPAQDARSGAWVSIIVKALLVLLSIPAGLIIAVRELHRETLAKLSRKSVKAPQVAEGEGQAAQVSETKPEKAPKVSETPAQVTETFQQGPQIFSDWKRVPEDVRKEIALLTHWSDVQIRYPYLKEKTAQNWLKAARSLYPQA